MSLGHSSNRYVLWLRRVSLYLLCSLALLGIFNYAIDPLWCFSHAHRFNRYQKPINQRQQKTNYFARQNRRYDAILLGNSRSMLINQKDFVGYDVFNYAVSAMIPSEYAAYLNYAKSVNGEFKTIFIGLDFTNSNANGNNGEERPEYYITNARSITYRYTSLLGGGATLLSLENIISSQGYLQNKFIRFDRMNIAHLGKFNEAQRKEQFASQLRDLTRIYTSEYRYDSDLAALYRRLIAENPRSKFVVFTTLVSKPFFCLMQKTHRYEEYERWLREVVNVFGTVYHFEYLHEVTRNYPATFLDAHHFYPSVGRLIAHKVTGQADPEIPADFGMLLTKETIDTQLAQIRQSCDECR